MYLALNAEEIAASLVGRCYRRVEGNRYRVLQADGEMVKVERLDGKLPLGGGATYWWHFSSITDVSGMTEEK